MIVLGGCCCKTDGDFFKEKGCLYCLHRAKKKLMFFLLVTTSFTGFFHQHQSTPVNNQVPVVPCRARSTKDIRTSNKPRAKCQKRLYRKAHEELFGDKTVRKEKVSTLSKDKVFDSQAVDTCVDLRVVKLRS